MERRHSKFMWLGTDLVFEAFTFHIVETEWGVFQLHCYPFDESTMSTFIVETDEATWGRAGLGRERGDSNWRRARATSARSSSAGRCLPTCSTVTS